MAGIYDLRLHAPEIAAAARPGQFVLVYCPGADKLLGRPISLCEANADTGEIRLVYRVVGAGTAELAALSAGDALDLLGPLGKGFPIEEVQGKRVLLLGGGIGVPPLLEAAKQLKTARCSRNEADTGTATVVLNGTTENATTATDTNVIAALGFRDNETFLADDFRNAADAVYTIEDKQGTVLDAVRENTLEADVIFACGPRPMLRAVQAYAKERDISCYLSLEERMACGVGACLACACSTKEVDAHTNVKNRRVCKDGPVFPAAEVEL